MRAPASLCNNAQRGHDPYRRARQSTAAAVLDKRPIYHKYNQRIYAHPPPARGASLRVGHIRARLVDVDVDLRVVLDREPSQLSGGELQRFAIGMSCVQKADM